MIDSEVSRLRQLRHTALKVRAIARALEGTTALRNEALLDNVACTAWRIARHVSGRLVAHPYLSYQRGPTVLDRVGHAGAAALSQLTAVNRVHGLKGFARGVRRLARELDDARALTWSLELSDGFSRGLTELNAALRSIEIEVGATGRAATRGAPARATYAAALEGDWPYIAL